MSGSELERWVASCAHCGWTVTGSREIVMSQAVEHSSLVSCADHCVSVEMSAPEPIGVDPLVTDRDLLTRSTPRRLGQPLD